MPNQLGGQVNRIRLMLTGLLLAGGCTTEVTNEHFHTHEGDTVTNVYTVEDDTDADPGETDMEYHAPITPNTAVADLDFDLFETPGLVLWIDASPETIETMNEDWQNGEWFGPVYTVNDETPTILIDHLYAQLPDGRSTDYGQIEAKLAGQSSGYPWATDTIPNFNLKVDEVTEDQLLGGFSRLRLNNGQVGSMLGERSALMVYDAFGYQVPKTTYILVGGSGWQNSDLLLPYIGIEKYKKDFCKGDRADYFGGGCNNIWEAVWADITNEAANSFASQCELSECDETRLYEFADVVTASMGSQEFEEATAPYFDWPAYRTFQCSEWLLWIGDDALHNMNNILLTEGQDGKFRYHPYSTDISGGVAWDGAYTYVPLYGDNAMSMGCQYDESCWAQTVARCEELISELEALDAANTIIAPLRDELQAIVYPWGNDGGDGAWRTPDDERYDILYEFYSTRAANAREELEQYRAPWVLGDGDTGMDFDTDLVLDSDLVVDTGDTNIVIQAP